MVLKPDQQRVKSLIQETLTLLCKNGLHYDTEFTIDAVIGVTLDKNNLFYMSIAETVTGGGKVVKRAKGDETETPQTAISETETQNHVSEQSPPKAKKRRQLKKEEEESFEVSLEPEASDQEDVDLENLLEVGEPSDAKKSRLLAPTKTTPIKIKVDKEIGTVIVKQEVMDDDSWAGDAGEETFESEGETSMTSFEHSTPGPSRKRAGQTVMFPASDGDQSGDGQWAGVFSDESGLTQAMAAASDQSITDGDQVIKKSHSSGKPTTCADCGKNYASHSSLMRHRNIVHIKKFPYYCTFCEKGCEDRRYLERHLVSHTGVKNHACWFCKKTFKTETCVKKHMKLCHHALQAVEAVAINAGD